MKELAPLDDSASRLLRAAYSFAAVDRTRRVGCMTIEVGVHFNHLMNDSDVR